MCLVAVPSTKAETPRENLGENNVLWYQPNSSQSMQHRSPGNLKVLKLLVHGLEIECVWGTDCFSVRVGCLPHC